MLVDTYQQMARLVRLCKGQWWKSQQGAWRFEEDPITIPSHILIGNIDQVEDVTARIRCLFGLRRQTPMLITFELPQWMNEGEGDT